MRRLERARERARRAKARAWILPMTFFGAGWVAVTAQMATGNDPALSSAPIASISRQAASAGGPNSSGGGSTAGSDGGVVVTQAPSVTVTVPTPVQAPAPVTTSQS